MLFLPWETEPFDTVSQDNYFFYEPSMPDNLNLTMEM